MSVAEVATGALVRPAWQRVRFWIAVAIVLIIGAVLVSTVQGAPARDLDPSSSTRSGSKALAVVLARYGAYVDRATSLAAADSAPSDSTLLVAEPFAYTTGQLERIAATHAHVVLVAPSAHELSAFLHSIAPAGIAPVHIAGGTAAPDCTDPGAQAAGTVELPAETVAYGADGADGADGSAVTCYGGAVVRSDRLDVLGSPNMLHNHLLADQGLAALDVNVLTGNGARTHIVWLLPGVEPSGSGGTSVWKLFPDAIHRMVGWLAVIALALALWRGRRFGPVVTEPLPVVVRAAEVVEGHGRLYRRASARERAAGSLRAATLSRLAAHHGLPRNASVTDITSAVASMSGRSTADVATLLGSAVPHDDAALVRLAHDLDALETAAGVPAVAKSEPNRPQKGNRP